jgi:hypothetical protein
MTNPPRLKRRFQIHLSTAIVMMFVAGGLIWANVSGTRHPSYNYIEHGWPFRSQMHFVGLGSYEGEEMPYLCASIDGMVAITFLLITHAICEWLIRRRAARKDA